jgi:hypothetical protein
MSQGSSGGGLIAVSVVDPYNAGWTVSWSYSGQSYSVGESGSYSWFINPPYVPIQLSFTASITNNPSGYTCQIQPSSITKTYNAGSVQTFTVTCSPAVYLTVVYTYNIWNPYPTYTIYYNGGVNGSISGPPNESGPGTHTYNYVIATNGPITLTTAINNPDLSHITCSVSPQSTTANPGQSVTININCNYNNRQTNQPPPPPPPPPPPNACPASNPSVSSQPPGAPQPTSSANVSSIPYNQTETVIFTYNAPSSGNNYVFQYWVIGGSKYTGNVVTITETLTCTTPGQTLTGPSGTAYYQYQPPGTISIDPDTIDLTKTSETYKFTWTSAWSGTGTFTYNFTGTVKIYYPNTVSGSPVWTATVSLPSNTIAASGTGALNVTSYPTPPNWNYYVECTVSGSGTINGVSAGAGIEYGTAYITCTLESKNGK